MKNGKAYLIEDVAELFRLGPLTDRYRYAVDERAITLQALRLFGSRYAIQLWEISYYRLEQKGDRAKLLLAVHSSPSDIEINATAVFGPKRRESGLTIFELPMSAEQAQRLARVLDQLGVAANAPRTDSAGQRHQQQFRRDMREWARAMTGTYALPSTGPGGIVLGLLFPIVAFVATVTGRSDIPFVFMLAFGAFICAGALLFTLFEARRVVIDAQCVTVHYPRDRQDAIRVNDIVDIDVPPNYRLNVRLRTSDGGVSFRLTSEFMRALARVPLEARVRLGIG